MTVEKTLEYQKRKIFYRVSGEGPDIVLLHGVPFDGRLWNNPVTKLPGFKFIVPDLPGSGASRMTEDMSMEGMAEVIKAILDQEEIFQTSIIGHSVGGYISLAFAEKYPQRLNGLGLFHSTAYPDSEERKEARIKAIEFINNNGAFEFIKTSIPKLFAPHDMEKNSINIDEFLARANNFSPQSLVLYYRAMLQRPDRTFVLKELRIPMLLVAGKYDSAVPLNDVLKQCHLPEKSYFHILARSGHLGMIEETEKTISILKNYLINLP